MIHLFGIIDMTILRVDADTVEEATEKADKLNRKPADHLTSWERREGRLRFHFEWQEYPTTEIEAARNAVLAAFLDLMSKLPIPADRIATVQSRIVSIDGQPISTPAANDDTTGGS